MNEVSPLDRRIGSPRLPDKRHIDSHSLEILLVFARRVRSTIEVHDLASQGALEVEPVGGVQNGLDLERDQSPAEPEGGVKKGGAVTDSDFSLKAEIASAGMVFVEPLRRDTEAL